MWEETDGDMQTKSVKVFLYQKSRILFWDITTKPMVTSKQNKKYFYTKTENIQKSKNRKEKGKHLLIGVL